MRRTQARKVAADHETRMTNVLSVFLVRGNPLRAHGGVNGRHGQLRATVRRPPLDALGHELSNRREGSWVLTIAAPPG